VQQVTVLRAALVQIIQHMDLVVEAVPVVLASLEQQLAVVMAA
jgi:hypothetical protein